MTFLENIDFYNHDGVNRGMINDFMRNQFYENIIADNVKDQHCIDIGFGTGLLSIIALKHGAKHITAFEADQNRYQLGLTVINQLKLNDKITLINDYFTHSNLDHFSKVSVIFSETVNGNLWQEGLLKSLPRKPGINFLPGEYFLEIYALKIPEIFSQGLINFYENQGFTPGVDIDPEFVQLINTLGFPNHQLKSQKSLNEINIVNPGQDTEWGWIPYLRLGISCGKLISGYSINAIQSTTTFVHGPTIPTDLDRQFIECSVNTQNWNNQCTLLIPRAGMKHNEHKLYLDTGHWGPTQFPAILKNPTKNIKVEHNLISGDINFTLIH